MGGLIGSLGIHGQILACKAIVSRHLIKPQWGGQFEMVCSATLAAEALEAMADFFASSSALAAALATASASALAALSSTSRFSSAAL